MHSAVLLVFYYIAALFMMHAFFDKVQVIAAEYLALQFDRTKPLQYDIPWQQQFDKLDRKEQI